MEQEGEVWGERVFRGVTIMEHIFMLVINYRKPNLFSYSHRKSVRSSPTLRTASTRSKSSTLSCGKRYHRHRQEEEEEGEGPPPPPPLLLLLLT